MSRLALWAVLALAGCGGASIEAEEPVATPLPDPGGEGSGGEAVMVVPYVVDFLSLVPPAANLAVVVRVDLLRGSRFAPLLAEAMREVGELRELAAAGVDPMQDVDRFLVAGREEGSDPDVIAIEHRWSEAQVIEVYTRLSEVTPGSTPQIQPGGRFRVVSFPGSVASLILLTPTVAAFAPGAMVPAIVERAQAAGSDAGDTARRLRLLDARAPDLAASGVVRVSATDAAGGSDWSRETSELGLPAPSWVTAIAALDDGATAFVEGGYASEANAQGAERVIRSLLSQTTNPMGLLLRLMGLGRALQASQVARDGTLVTFRTHLAPDELDRVIERLRGAGP